MRKIQTKKKISKIKKNKTRKNSRNNQNKIAVNSEFESGNIIHKSTNNNKVVLEIKDEPYKKSTKNKYQNWFYFKVTGIKQRTHFTIKNIHNYDNDWKGFNVCYSYDNKTWKRKTTRLINKTKLEWSINPKKSTVWFAYYPPYPFSKSKKLFRNMKTIGKSGEGRPIYMKTLGTGKYKVWLISGQHPGETVNSWMLEGFVKRLMERKNKMFKKFTFYIIPNANPDGNVHGHWYVTKQGINLNRDWKKFKSPEVKAIKKQIDTIGYSLVFDLHGDEGSKNHFLVEIKSKHPLFDFINKRLNQKNKHFQIENYYKPKYMKHVKDTLDEYTMGITMECATKHGLFNHKTLQQEPIKIGKDLADILYEL